MRQRHIKDIEEKIAAYGRLLLEACHGDGSGGTISSTDVSSVFVPSEPSLRYAEGHPLRWYELAAVRLRLPDGYARVYAEIGCGRGRFLNETAAADSDALYIGVEGQLSVAIKALEKTEAAGLANVRYALTYISDLTDLFGEAALDGLYLHFPDPWPKDRHEKRRLTSAAHARGFFAALKPGGFLELRTDNEAFFDYSRVQIPSAGFRVAAEACGLTAPRAQTEYERKFTALGLPVYFLRAEKPAENTDCCQIRT